MKQKEIEGLKRIVNEAFLVDLDVDNRKREVVDARKIYSKILRDIGYSYEAIGSTINKNHATIIHYVKNIEHLLSYDQSLYFKYVACKNVFVEKKESISDQIKKDADVYVTAIRLTTELQQAVSYNNYILDEFVSYIELYELENGCLPTISEYRRDILPLFNR